MLAIFWNFTIGVCPIHIDSIISRGNIIGVVSLKYSRFFLTLTLLRKNTDNIYQNHMKRIRRFFGIIVIEIHIRCEIFYCKNSSI